ncbi:uncharacterized protein LJ206_005824 [Theristicus caerulescens]
MTFTMSRVPRTWQYQRPPMDSPLSSLGAQGTSSGNKSIPDANTTGSTSIELASHSHIGIPGDVDVSVYPGRNCCQDWGSRSRSRIYLCINPGHSHVLTFV